MHAFCFSFWFFRSVYAVAIVVVVDIFSALHVVLIVERKKNEDDNEFKW